MPDENVVLNYIKVNPANTAIKLVRNNKLLAEKNPKKMMPLASTLKIILAIEYAEQAAAGTIDPDSTISFDELAKFYVPHTDGGSHPSWLKSVKDYIPKDAIPIREIAKGMIKYSSNANTEWLFGKLGLANINHRLNILGIKDHSKLFYVGSAIFVGKEKFPNYKGKELADKLQALPIEAYIAVTEQIYQKLLTDNSYKRTLGDLNMKVQKVWSDNIPSSTVEEYVSLMQKINSRTYFSAKTQAYLDEVMEYLLEYPANRKWFTHAGMKGGGTAFVLTKALYATDKQGNKTELAYFMNNLEREENKMLRKHLNEFEWKILSNNTFRENLEVELSEK